ncbi:hypothetical protein GGR56DRAFT_670522 [Xylariaceae sp. FL0804]|nr:hypothetical protein GGR56DRAFT_670522 [Xylariaceae sp. FL0804]
MPRNKSFGEILPKYGLHFGTGAILSAPENMPVIKWALIRGLPGFNWQTTDARLRELFATCLELAHLFTIRGLADDFVQFRLRAMHPENYAAAHNPQYTASSVVETLDEWIEFLRRSGRGQAAVAAPFGLPAQHQNQQQQSGAGPAATTSSTSSNSMAMELDSIQQQQQQHEAMRMRITQEKMEDMDLDEKEEPLADGTRRFFKNWDRDVHQPRVREEKAAEEEDGMDVDSEGEEDEPLPERV